MERESLRRGDLRSGDGSGKPDLRYLYRLEEGALSDAVPNSERQPASSDIGGVSLTDLINRQKEQRRRLLEKNTRVRSFFREIRRNNIPENDSIISEDDSVIPANIIRTKENVSGRVMSSWGDGLDEKNSPEYQEKVREIGRSGGAILGFHQPNEDACFAEPDTSVFGVFDGLGGMPGSYMASRFASSYFRTALMELREDISPGEACEEMKQIFARAQQEIRSKYPDKRIATTVSVFKAIMYQGKRFGIVLNVGDSRVYRFSGTDELEHKTSDAGEENPWYKEKGIQKAIAGLEDFKGVDPHLKLYVEQRHILYKTLSSNPEDGDVEPDVDHFEIKPGDMVILTSDGVHDNLTDNNMIACVKDKSPEEAASSLVKAAHEKSVEENDNYKESRAKPDDITALVAHY